MSGMSVARRDRRLGYRRHRRNEKAVSPVVATLILILIAVAAAAALYLWLTGWQGSVTKAIGQPVIPSDLKFSIGGSTTVFPLSQLGIKWYEQNNTNNNITDQQGGSVAGIEAWCAGQIDVAASSSSETQAQLTGDGCSATQAADAVQTVVGLDAIVGIASTKNPDFTATACAAAPTGAVANAPDCWFSLNATTTLAIYYADSTGTSPTSNAPAAAHSGSAAGSTSLQGYGYPAWLCGATAPTGFPVGPTFPACPPVGSGLSFNWNQIPFPAGCVNAATDSVAACFYATSENHAIQAYDRGDSSGTEQGFTQKYLGLAKDGSSNSCGTDNQLVSCGVVVTHEVGNPALASAVAGSAFALGFNSYGIASTTANVLIAQYQGTFESGASFDQSVGGFSVSISSILGEYRGTIALSATAGYQPWRVLEYITNGVPAVGSVQANYLNFVLGSAVNLALCDSPKTGFISLYAA
jgi:flagellin-like protein